MNKPIGWGKCFIIVKDLDTVGAKWILLPTPKEDSTQLTPTKGDKKEATIEGGENEDVKYGKNKYELAYTIRRNTERKKPFADVDGVVAHRYAVFVQPENVNVPGPKLDLTVVTLEDPFDTTDGGQLTYTHDALKPASGNTVKWAKINIDLSTYEEGAEIADNAIVFTDVDTESTSATFTAVDPKSTGYSSKNPSAEGWYIKNGTRYLLAEDTAVVEGTTYYARS